MATFDYCTEAEVRLTLGGASEQEVPSAQLAPAIVKGTADIRTVLPSDLVDSIDDLTISAIPIIINSICEDLSAYYVMRGIYRQNDALLAEWMDNYKAAYKKLEDIRDHKITIDEITSQEQVLSSTNDYVPTFDVDDPTKWTQDQNRLDDIATDRADV